jgi:hypothetical protein
VTVVPLQIPAFRVPGAVAGQPFARQIPVAGGRPPYAWEIESGSLPRGLTLEPSGRITGTPMDAGELAEYRLTVRDQKGASVTSSFDDTIASPGTASRFMILPSAMPSYGLDQDFGYQPLIQGGRLPWTFTIEGLPPGLDYDRSTGLISGTPEVEGQFAIEISVVDADGNVAEGSPASLATSIVPPQVVGGGDGGNGGSVGDCGSYEGTWIGQFNVEYVEVFEDTETEKQASFSATIRLQCIAGGVAGSTTLKVVHANLDDPFFRCQVAGCTPDEGSVALLPSETPTSPSNRSRDGHGISIIFPSGAQLVTNNFAGALEVSSLGDWIQSSLDAEQIGTDAFLAIDPAGTSYPPIAPGAWKRDVKSSWSFSKSGL